MWRRFDRMLQVKKFSRRQLLGPAGKKAVLDFLEGKLEGHPGFKGIPKPLWKLHIAALTSIWNHGLKGPFPWPRSEQPRRLPKAGRRKSPKRERVVPWHNAMEKQAEPYRRVLWHLLFDLGLRPQHVWQLRWADVVPDPVGRPYAIVALGKDHDFKVADADVKAWLPPAAARAIAEWEREAKDRASSAPLLPWRRPNGAIWWGKRMTTDQIHNLFGEFAREWRLDGLSPAEGRHFVKSACNRAGMDEVAREMLQGHKPAGMSGQYDDPEDDEDLFDRQRAALPRGALGDLSPPDVAVSAATPFELEKQSILGRWERGELSTRELADGLEAARYKALISATKS